ncbi:TetR/AcrR family transcriptional regulator [Antrihabitans sp. YC3-6]|uniref:TetR/AcrR family transcriptional regulator n=1 Tax=Antrihabitans stalagmiti TaxID=2799499 RepID=A0A934U2R0_9NOCA|nr:TetR/AcrR family transcriptional regulator [Antrihabitans stalagmiti]MBJ8339076.1 TetR/AcrR family transcriptional regulator [Antrihabitans stalagmiti]
MPTSESNASERRVYGGRSAAERGDERRRRLVDAALELFGTKGFSATSIEQLCSAANVSTRSFYEDIGSREKLLIALVEDLTSKATQSALDALAETQGEAMPVRMSRAFRAYLAVTCRDRRSARVCYVEVVGVSQVVEEWRKGWRERIAAVVVYEADSAVERGEAKSREYRLFAVAVIGAVNSLAQELALADESAEAAVTLDDICDEITHLAVAGLTV